MTVHQVRVLALAAVLVGAGAASAGPHGPVTATDTLWSLAERFRPDETVSVQRMMLALLEANPEAFTVQNVNALKVGAVLRIPTREEIGPDAKAEALAEVSRQHAEWGSLARGGQRKVASRLLGDLKKANRVVPSQDAFEESTSAARASTIPTGPSSPLLMNDDVVQMVVAGIGDDVVIQKIRTSGAEFRIDVDDFIQLKGAGVSDAVLSVMLEYPTAPKQWVGAPSVTETVQTLLDESASPAEKTRIEGAPVLPAASDPSPGAWRVAHDHRSSGFVYGCDGEVFVSAEGFRFVTEESDHSFNTPWNQVGSVGGKPGWGRAAFNVRVAGRRTRTFNFRVVGAKATGENKLEDLLELVARFQR